MLGSCGGVGRRVEEQARARLRMGIALVFPIVWFLVCLSVVVLRRRGLGRVELEVIREGDVGDLWLIGDCRWEGV